MTNVFKFMRPASALPCVLVLLVGGCAIGPDYQAPKPEPANWLHQTAQLDTQQSAAELHWKTLYKEAELQTFIEQALANNLDLKIATERMYRAAQSVTTTDADLLPQFSAQFFHDKEKLSQRFSGNQDIIDDFRLFGKVSWEIDLWGKLRRNSEASLAEYQASHAEFYGVQISLIGDVASLYYQIQDIKAQIELTNSNIVAREKSKRIAELRHEQGMISGLDVTQTNVELVKEQLKLPSLNNQLRSAKYSLSVLLGESPKFIKTEDRRAGLGIYDQVLPVGLPADLLKRRPDIIVQERKLQAASARIGAAKTDYFPNITLNAYYGGKSKELDDILDNAETWLFGADITMPLFTWGKTTANVNQAESNYREQVLNYRKTVLSALQETAEAIDSFEQTKVEYTLKGELLKATNENMRIARLRYKNGSISYLDVLDAQRNLADAAADYSSAINTHQNAFIRLYKALGGGWNAEQFDQQTTEASTSSQALNANAEATTPQVTN